MLSTRSDDDQRAPEQRRADALVSMAKQVVAHLEPTLGAKRNRPKVIATINVAHHLNLAGRAETLFSDDATVLIHPVARGQPRAVDKLAVQALIAPCATEKAIVDETSARAAITEITAE